MSLRTTDKRPARIEISQKKDNMKKNDDGIHSIKDASKYVMISSVVLWALYTYIVNEQYMDEVFHVPQGLSFHAWLNSGLRASAFHWNPVITTFPGVYIVSYLLGGFLVGPEYSLSVLSLFRFANSIAITGLMLYVVWRMTKSVGTTLMVVLFPLNYFYHFLFYTDPGATCFILASFWLLRERRFVASGIAGIAALAMRQTNIVWIFGFCLDYCVDSWKQRNGRNKIETMARLVFRILADLWIHVFIGIGFLIFFIKNNFSIVIGHHEYHSINLHWSQFNYFVLIVVVATEPSLWRLSRFTCFDSRREKILFAVGFVLALFASELGYIRHLFLNDTRHLTHALHRWVLCFRAVRSLVVPLLVAQGISKANIFRPSNNIQGLRMSIFWLCNMLVLVPTPLMEMRYFSVPCSLLLLGTSWCTNESEKWKRVKYFAALNLVSFILFLFFPITGDEGDTRRFMY